MNNRLEESRNFLELNGLNSIRTSAKTGTDEEKKAALQEAAQQFEAIFMQMLLKSMRKAEDVLASDSPFNSESTKFYRDMHDQQMAVEISSNGTLGLSDLIVRQLGGDDNFTPQTILRNDGDIDSRQTFAKNYTLYEQAQADAMNAKSASNNDADKNANQRLSVTSFYGADHVSNNRQSSEKFDLAGDKFSPQERFPEPTDFVSALTAPAKIVENKLGIPFEVVIAQAALETGWGKKIIKNDQGESTNNLFNIKADSRWEGDKVAKETLEFEQGTMVKKTAPFRSYSSMEESVKDYVNFLSSGERYKDALNKIGNVEQFLQGIQKAGYATDPNYADKIQATLRTVSGLLNQN